MNPLSQKNSSGIEQERLKKELIEETINGGMMAGYNEPGFPFYYISQAMLRHLGYGSEEDYIKDTEGLIEHSIHPDDLEMVNSEVAGQLKNLAGYKIEYRIKKADGTYIWVRDFGKLFETEDSREVIISVVYDITVQKEIERKDREHYRRLEDIRNQLVESQASMQAAIDAAQISFFEYFPERDYAVQYNGREAFELDGRMENYPESWFEKKITHPMDEQRLRDAFSKIKDGKRKENCTVRNYIDGSYHWYYYNFTSIYDISGQRSKVVCTAQDITEEKEAEKINKEYRRLYERTPGWIFTCRNDEAWTLEHTNSHIRDIIGYTQEEFLREKNNSIASIIPEQYQKMIKEHIQEMQQRGFGSSVSYETPVCHRDGSYTWLNVNLYWDKKGTDGIWYVSCSNITSLKKKQEELREKNARYKLTTEHANINLWTYDIENGIMYNSESSGKAHPGERVICDFVNWAVRGGMIREDSVDDFKQMYEQLSRGEEALTRDIWLKKNDGSGYWCERITQVPVFNEQHKAYKAFGIGSDVTEFKEAAARLEEEQRYQDEMDNEDILLRTRCNITRDKVEILDTKPEMTMPLQAETYTGGLEQLASRAYSEADRKRIFARLSPEKLERTLKENGSISFEYGRKNQQKRMSWMRVNVRVLSHPDTHDTIAFINITDITSQKKQAMIIKRIVEIDYEVLALIYAKQNEIECIRASHKEEDMSIDYTLPYDQSIHQFIEKYIQEDKREAATEEFKLSHIKKRLDENGVFEISYALYGEKTYQKKWEFTYFDEAKTIIIYTRADITELFREQEQQKENLSNALIQAEEASKAKTNFLSRMSHEIRTPMNAIIGMNTLAAQTADKPEQVRDCLSKIGISARFLLSLINDILDMSRIESGKVTVKHEKFPLEEIISNVSSIFYEQAEKKGVDYDCVISSFTYDYYIGDATKIQQILVNLLGNAMKFTEPGGRIQLIVNQERVANGKAYMCFAVNDTGIGIKPELQKKMFEPFEQGDTTITTPYKGTGLGLAIAKNLINMMDGTIKVHSILDVGSEFVVRIPLGICENVEKYQSLKLDIPLQKLSTLIVDDDITICEHTKVLLSEIGMKAEWVESGFRAVELIQNKWDKEEYFDVVLLDWKMPDMDGIETARNIRRIVGESVTIIVMTAYDWPEIEQEARLAGVNLLVQKPLFKNSLISVYESAFKKKEEKKVKENVMEYDFTGKHILLVEDHILNVEVAKRLLEMRHAEVVVADNGLHAIETFMEAPDRYFDAILMDIRMPVMDGLTATRSIRQLRRSYAKSVPILAMSANAFDEDVEKSKEAGMNEHLSKPIEPQLLYAALEKWFQINEE